MSLLAPPAYERWASDSPGVGFFPLCSLQQYERSLADLHLLNWRYGPLFLQRHAIQWNVAMFQVAQSLRDKNPTLLVVHRGMLWADSVVRSRLRIPVFRLEIDPPFRHLNEPKLPWGRVQMNLLGRLERQWRDAIGDFGVKQRLGHLSRFRSAGLPAPSVPRIALYPGWFTRNEGPKAVSKFCFVPPPTLAAHKPIELKKKTTEILIVFMAGTQGTVSHWSRHFFSVSTAICRRHRYRALLLGGSDPGISNSVPEASIEWRQHALLSDVLPHADAIVHHGGIGTAAAAIEYGVPQLVLPRFATQPSNAEWIRHLGVGTVMHEYGYTEEQGAEQIARLLTDDRIKKHLRPYIGRCYSKRMLSRLLRFLERSAPPC